MKEITNIKQLRRASLATISGLISKKLKPQIAREITGAIGNTIGTLKLELEYAKLRKETPAIPFLDSATKPKLALKN